MAVRRILTVDDEADAELLRQPSAKVGAVDQEINKLVRDMIDTMFEVRGHGCITAIQIWRSIPGRSGAEQCGSTEDEATTRTIVFNNSSCLPKLAPK